MYVPVAAKPDQKYQPTPLLYYGPSTEALLFIDETKARIEIRD